MDATKKQKEAAISLGLTEEFWCNDPDTGKNECFALEADIPPEFATEEQPEWNDYDWWELPQGFKEVLLANQYTEESWCNNEATKENECLVLEGDIPSEFASQYWGDSDWVELPDELKEALVSAGLNEESWCNDGATGDNTCTTLEADITPAPTTASPTPKPTTSSPSKQPTVSPSANPVGESNDGKPTVSPVEMATTTTTATTTVVTTTAEGTTTTTTTPDDTATTTPDETTTVAATTTTVATTTTTEGTTTDATTTVDPTTTAAATTEAPPTTTTATTTPEDIEPPPNRYVLVSFRDLFKLRLRLSIFVMYSSHCICYAVLIPSFFQCNGHGNNSGSNGSGCMWNDLCVKAREILVF